MLTLVSPKKRSKVENFIYKEDKCRSLIGEILVRKIICQKLELSNDQIVFKTNSYGKPYLVGYPDFHFNISHAGDWVVCAVDKKQVGVDIEKIKPIDYKIAKRFFSKQEYQDLMRKESLDYFYKLWTLKESYIKAMGKGLSIPLDLFTIKVDKGEIKFSSEKYTPGYFKQISLDNDYILSVCSFDQLAIKKIL